jgi:hypothetical protein
MRAGERVPERECGTDDSPARLTHVDRLNDITGRIFPLASEFTAQPPARAISATIHNHHADPPTKSKPREGPRLETAVFIVDFVPCLPALRARTPVPAWARRAVGEDREVLSESRMREICLSGSRGLAFSASRFVFRIAATDNSGVTWDSTIGWSPK